MKVLFRLNSIDASLWLLAVALATFAVADALRRVIEISWWPALAAAILAVAVPAVISQKAPDL